MGRGTSQRQATDLFEDPNGMGAETKEPFRGQVRSGIVDNAPINTDVPGSRKREDEACGQLNRVCVRSSSMGTGGRRWKFSEIIIRNLSDDLLCFG